MVNRVVRLTCGCAMQTEALASSAVRATTKLGAKIILAFTKTGRTARYLAKYRSAVPIVTVCACALLSYMMCSK
jgi:pyruvate kinase